MKIKLVFLLLCCTVAFAKDKKDEAKPAVDPKTQIEILKDQRDYANLARSVMPQEIELNRREQVLKSKLEEAQAQCGEVTKWRLNPTNMECDEVKPPAPAPAAPTVPEPKKDN